MKHIANLLAAIKQGFLKFWHRSWWNKSFVIIVVSVAALTGAAYSVARWYQLSEQDKPLNVGVSFIPAYAESLGLDAPQTLDALIDDLGVKHIRLVSYWSQLEAEQGSYDFELLDWQFERVEQAGGTITLSVGLRQPRWPECHIPDWASDLSDAERKTQLNQFIAAVVARYKNSPALISYQLENEFLLTSFAPHCPEITPEQVSDELALIKSIDPNRPVIISRSNNLPTIPLREPVPDEYGISVYRRVWDSTFTERYFQYPYPAWYYAFLAGMQKIVHDKPSMLHELQAEAWPAHGQSITETNIEEQNKTIDADRLQDTFKFGRDTGLRDIYLWGAEYWYYRKIILNDPSLWDVAQQEFESINN